MERSFAQCTFNNAHLTFIFFVVTFFANFFSLGSMTTTIDQQLMVLSCISDIYNFDVLINIRFKFTFKNKYFLNVEFFFFTFVHAFIGLPKA